MTPQRGVVHDVKDSSDKQADDVTTRIVSHIAAREGVEPETLTPRLYTAVDPEAVANLVDCASAEAPLSIEFRYAGYKVHINAAEQVDIDATQL